MKPDLFDCLIFVGIALLGVGLWLIYPPISLITLGTISFGIGIYGAWRKGKAGEIN